VGPTFDPEELAGRKVIALFDRAAARDFADVYTLPARFGKPLLLARATEIDLGFNRHIFADMLRTLDRARL
jgi:predicted nucleotidyltransferase component of viral defense system